MRAVSTVFATLFALAFSPSCWAQPENMELNPFEGKEHLGIYLNYDVANIMTHIRASDRLVLLYIFHSGDHIDEHGQNWTVLNNMFAIVLSDLKAGYVTTYAIDCQVEHPEIDPELNLASICAREEKQPIFNLYKPAEVRINPYTGKEMPQEVIGFASNQVSEPDVKKWITDNVPDYTNRLSTMQDADQFAEESGIKKVYLFSGKQKVPPIYKALSSNFRNRLRFAFVNLEAAASKDLSTRFDIKDWPTLLIANESGDGESHIVYEGKMKLTELIDFVEPAALTQDQAKEERVISSKSQTTVNQQSDASGYMLLTSVREIGDKILDDWKGAILYIAKKDELTHLPILESYASNYRDFLNVALLVVDDPAESSAELKNEFKSAKLPQFRFYPNNKTGQEKKSASFEIILPKNADEEETKATILEEVQSNYLSDVKDVTEKVYYSLGGQNARDGKITVLYMYDGDVGMEFAYRAVSADPWLQDDFVFMALDGPTTQLNTEGKLPAMQGMLNIDEENPAPRVFQFAGMQQVHYGEVTKNLMQMVPGKWEAYEEDWRMKQYKKQNPGHDADVAKNPSPREFIEIRSQADYERLCKQHKACALALLPAITTIDYENESFLQKLEILVQADATAGKDFSPVYYGWVNATCHGEVFSYFDVDPTSLPTVIYYHSQHNKYGTMIGKFDSESIADHEDRFKNGKLSLREAKVAKNSIKFTEVDCQKQLLETVQDDDDEDFNEILAEILAEEKARKEAEELANGGSSKRGGKKKGKKGKKGKKKAGQNDEL